MTEQIPETRAVIGETALVNKEDEDDALLLERNGYTLETNPANVPQNSRTISFSEREIEFIRGLIYRRRVSELD